MTRTKKVLGLLLALAMVFGCMTMAFATDPGADARAASITVATTANELAAGESATITVSATTNFTASTWSVPVFYNKTLVSIAVTSVGGTAIATDADAVDSSLVYANTGYDEATYGFVLVQFTAENGETIADTLNSKEIVSFTVTALADVEGDAVVVVPATALKTTSNANGKLYFGCSTEGTTVSGVPELVSNIDTTAATQTIAIGATMLPADLALTDAGATAGVIIDTNKTFGGAYAGVVYGFEQVATTTFRTNAYLTNNLQVTNEGTWELSRSYGTAGYGNGTVITVKNADDTVSKTYVVVIFGDVNGDGLINANDTTALKAAVQAATNAPANSVKRMAANCQKLANGTMMHTLNANDTAALKNHINGTSKFTQAALATTQNTYNNFYQ